MPAAAGVRVNDARQAAVRPVVVLGNLLFAERDKRFPRHQRHGAALGDGPARQLEGGQLGLAVHVGADVAGQFLGGPNPQALVDALNHAPRLAVVGQAVLHIDAQAAHEADRLVAHHVVDVARAVVHVEDGRNAALGAGVAQGIDHHQGRLGQAGGPSRNSTGTDVDDGGDFRPEGPAVHRVLDLGVERVAVAGIDVGRE